MSGSGVYIDARDLHFSYRGRAILDGASLSAREGEVVALLGPNGAGKSTLLRLMLGLLAPTRGEVLVNGEALKRLSGRELARRIAYVPQSHATPFPYTVREVVLLGRLPSGGLLRAPTREDHDVVSEVLQRLSIGHLADRVYTEISGGERQLTLVARALVQQTRVLIMDEPMASLDFGYQTRLAAHLRRLAEAGYAVIMSTHDPGFSRVSTTRVALLSGGRIIADGDPKQVLTPAVIATLYNISPDEAAQAQMSPA